MPQSLWVSTRKGLFHFARRDEGWRIVHKEFLGAQVTIVCASPDGDTIFAALKHGHFGTKVHRSLDNGTTWQEIATPTFPPKPDDVPDVIDPMRNKPIPWSLDMIWSLECSSNGRLWCGTLPGGLFYSDDRGDSWELNMPLWSLPNRQHWFGGGYDLPGIHSICIDPRDPNRVTIAISSGGVWQTEDHGESWQCRADGMRAEYMPPDQAFNPDIQDPHRMVQCSSSPDCFWVQHHNGIFKSTDNCRSWQEIKDVLPSGFGFAVVVHPEDPAKAWFVPAVRDSDRYPVNGEFVVTRTQDEGKSFHILRKGLPQSDAFHLVYRHAMDIDSSGSTLAIGSTTGGLWVSCDEGENWELLTQDLPPIYAVRFGQSS